MLEVSEAAMEVLERAYEAATRFNPSAKVRLYRRGGRVEAGLADAAQAGDEVIELDGLTVFVEEGIAGTLDVSGEHDALVVR